MSDVLAAMIAGMFNQAATLLTDWMPLVAFVLGLPLALGLGYYFRDLFGG